MGAAWKVTLEGGGGFGSLGKVLPCGSSGGTIVWSGNMGAYRDNNAAVRGITCNFPAEEMRRRDGSWQKLTEEAVLQGAGTQSPRTYVDRRQVTGGSGGVSGHPTYF